MSTITARPTVYKNIQMRSRLEAAFAQLLDRRGHPWEYEPDCFANETGQYLPDFKIKSPGRELQYVEVKPEPILADPVALAVALRKMEVIWDANPRVDLSLYVGRRYPAVFDTRFLARGSTDQLWRVTTPILPLPLVLELD